MAIGLRLLPRRLRKGCFLFCFFSICLGLPPALRFCLSGLGQSSFLLCFPSIGLRLFTSGLGESSFTLQPQAFGFCLALAFCLDLCLSLALKTFALRLFLRCLQRSYLLLDPLPLGLLALTRSFTLSESFLLVFAVYTIELVQGFARLGGQRR